MSASHSSEMGNSMWLTCYESISMIATTLLETFLVLNPMTEKYSYLRKSMNVINCSVSSGSAFLV